MEQRFLVNPFKCLVGLVCCVFFIVMGGCMIPMQRWESVLIFWSLGIVFAFIAALCGAVIHINSIGVRRTTLGLLEKKMSWDDIQEVGVAGTKVFNKNHPEKTGSLYLYFSKEAMTYQGRFDMMIKWPPKDKIYLIYDEKRVAVIQSLWDNKIETFNVGDLAL